MASTRGFLAGSTLWLGRAAIALGICLQAQAQVPSCTLSTNIQPGPDGFGGNTLYPLEVGDQLIVSAECTGGVTQYEWTGAFQGSTGTSPTYVHTIPWNIGGHGVRLVATNASGSDTWLTIVNFLGAGTTSCADPGSYTVTAGSGQLSLPLNCVNFGRATVGFGSVAWRDEQGAPLSGVTSNNGLTISIPVPSVPSSYVYRATVTSPNTAPSNPNLPAVELTIPVNVIGPLACHLNASPSTIPAGTSVNVSLFPNCANGGNTLSSPVTYSWAQSPGAPAPAPSTNDTDGHTTVAFPSNVAPGTYTYTVTASNPGGTAQSAATVTVTAPSAPQCTAAATPNSFAAGTATVVSLTASCTNSPTSYSWSSSSGAPTGTQSGNTASIPFPANAAPGTYTFTVTATNAGGSSQAAATVTVTASAPSVPQCTLSVTPSSFPAGGSGTVVTLAASCTNSPTSYAWSSSPGGLSINPSGNGSTATVPFAVGATPGTYTFTVSATNASGTGQATATVTVTTPGPPQCTVSATPGSLTAGTAGVVSLSASCSNSPTTYRWSSSSGSLNLVATFSIASVSFPASTPAGRYTFTVEATNAGGTSSASISVDVVASTTAATPVCSVTASPPSVAPGGSSTLSASCVPGASSYAWSGACANSSAATCLVTPQATTTYAVSGVSSAGTGAPSRVVVSVVPPQFPLAVTTTITSTNAQATAQVQPRSEDTGTTKSIFVFAHAPASLFAHAAEAKRVGPGIPLIARQNDGTDPCILAQLNSSGQLQPVSASTMQPAVTSVLSAQGQAVTILNNVPTSNVAGVSFLVGYGTTASSMLAAGNYEGAVTVPGPSQCTALLLAAAAPKSPDSLSGLWWNPAESGWGIHFTQRGGTVFAAWYTYDAAGNPKWYVASNCTMGAAGGGSGSCSGALFEVNGASFFGAAFNPALVNAHAAGNLAINFQNTNAASMTYTVGGQTRTVPLSRQTFGTGTTPAVDYTDLWWNPAESGWGMAISHQGGIMFLAWYVYDSAGKPIWYVAPNCLASGSSCVGDVYRTTGPVFGPTFDSGSIKVFAVGNIQARFADANNGTLTYTVDGVSQSKVITRQLF